MVIPVGTLIFLNLTYPLYGLYFLMTLKQSFKHTLPKLERCCNLSFLRENMLLASVLDTFCISNNIEICKKPIPFGRTMGVWTLLTQDGPQYVVHVMFLFVLQTDLDYAEFTVVVSIFVSSIAIQVTICNIILGSMKEFDPVILQLELKRRKEMAQEKQDRLNQQR